MSTRFSRALLALTVAATCCMPLGSFAPAGAKAARATVVRSGPKLSTQAAVERFRTLLGPDNDGAPGGDPAGRREINWDGVPDEQAEPNAYVGDFFNADTAPRARGAVLRSVGGGRLAVSAREGNPGGAAPRFGNINPSYASQFATLSPERLFSPVGSNTVDMTFRVPGTSIPAVVRGFGAVYTDVDRPESAAFRYYDARNRLLGTYSVPAAPAGLSFLGVVFGEPIVARVRIVYGNRALGPTETSRIDVAVMDDFLYGEPQPVP